MKLKNKLIAVVLIFSAITVSAQDDLFSKFSNNENVTHVLVTKSLLSMIPDISTGGMNIKSLADKLDRLEIYTCNNPEIAKQMIAEVEPIKNDKSYETLMSIKDKDEKLNFYMQKDSDDKFKELIMIVEAPNESTIIRIIGSFTMQDIQNVTGVIANSL